MYICIIIGCWFYDVEIRVGNFLDWLKMLICGIFVGFSKMG